MLEKLWLYCRFFACIQLKKININYYRKIVLKLIGITTTESLTIEAWYDWIVKIGVEIDEEILWRRSDAIFLKIKKTSFNICICIPLFQVRCFLPDKSLCKVVITFNFSLFTQLSPPPPAALISRFMILLSINNG